MSALNEAIEQMLRAHQNASTQERERWSQWAQLVGCLGDPDKRNDVLRSIDVTAFAHDIGALLGALGNSEVVAELSERIDWTSVECCDSDMAAVQHMQSLVRNAHLPWVPLVHKERSWWMHALQTAHSGKNNEQREEAQWLMRTLLGQGVLTSYSSFHTAVLGASHPMSIRHMCVAFGWDKLLLKKVTDAPLPQNPVMRAMEALSIVMRCAAQDSNAHPSGIVQNMWNGLDVDGTEICAVLPEHWRSHWGWTKDEPVCLGVVLCAMLGHVHNTVSAWYGDIAEHLGKQLSRMPTQDCDRSVVQLAKALTAAPMSAPMGRPGREACKALLDRCSDEARAEVLEIIIKDALARKGSSVWDSVCALPSLRGVLHKPEQITLMLQAMMAMHPVMDKGAVIHHHIQQWWTHKNKIPQSTYQWCGQENASKVVMHMDVLHNTLAEWEKNKNSYFPKETREHIMLTLSLFQADAWNTSVVRPKPKI